MTTSGSTIFDLNLIEIIEEAFERAGSELRSGYDLKTARRSLNLLLIEWQNKGINMWTLDSGEIPLLTDVGQYELPIDTVDLIDHVVRTDTGVNQTDLHINRVSVSTYASIPNKLVTGRPNRIYIERRTGATNFGGEVQNPRVNIWPVPDNDTYTLVYWRMRRIQDVTDGVTTQDIPYRFLPCLIAGLAYQLSLKLPQSMDRIPMLKAMYDEQWDMAASEDREKAPLYLAPSIC